MYLKTKFKKLIICFIALILIFQFISVTLIEFRDLDHSTQKSITFLLSRTVHIDTSHGNMGSRRNAYNHLSPDFITSYVRNSFLSYDYLGLPLYYTVLADNRKEIKQDIPHYFNGSKYKDTSLLLSGILLHFCIIIYSSANNL